MDFKTLGENIVARAKKLGADEAEAYLQRSKSFNVTVRNGEVETLQKSVARGLGLRVFIDKQLGFSYTSDLSLESLEETARKTVELAGITEAKPWQGLPDFGPGILPGLDLYDPEIAGVPDEKKISIAREAEKTGRGLDPRITNSYGASFSDSEGETGIYSSRGISYAFKETIFSFGVNLVAGEKDAMQSGGWSGVKRFFKELDSVEDVARIAVQKTVEKLNPKPVATKKVPVIFDRYAAPSFWMGVLLSLDGDSAFRETTFMSDQLEKAIASPLITLADDPTVPRFVGSMPFDGEGNITRRNVIIDKGILKMFRYDSQTARKAGVKSGTIAGRSGYRSMPGASFLCVTLDNGTESGDSIIHGIKEGLLVTEMRGLGTDATTGSFSVGCGGFWIVDGAVAYPVDGVTLGGSTLELLKSIDKVGNDLDMRGGFNSPSFRVAELTVGGKK